MVSNILEVSNSLTWKKLKGKCSFEIIWEQVLIHFTVAGAMYSLTCVLSMCIIAYLTHIDLIYIRWYRLTKNNELIL